MKHRCPVCGYPDLMEAPVLSYEICPSCGTEFGYTDSAPNDEARSRRHYELMLEWLRTGPRWHAGWQPQPEGWNGRKQVLEGWFARASNLSTPASQPDLSAPKPIPGNHDIAAVAVACLCSVGERWGRTASFHAETATPRTRRNRTHEVRGACLNHECFRRSVPPDHLEKRSAAHPWRRRSPACAVPQRSWEQARFPIPIRVQTPEPSPVA